MKKTLVGDDSLISGVDVSKLKTTEVDATPGATINDVLRRLQTRDKHYDKIIVCAGTNDCDSHNMDGVRFEASYRDVVRSAKDRVRVARDVCIASIPPRSDSPSKNDRVTAANEMLKGLASRMGVTYIDNDPSFKLGDGSINDGYIAKDGLHLTAAGTNRLIKNMKLTTVNGAVNVVKSGRPATRQRRSTTIEQHDGRQYPHRNAADKSAYRRRPEGRLDHHHNERHSATANVENDDRAVTILQRSDNADRHDEIAGVASRQRLRETGEYHEQRRADHRRPVSDAHRCDYSAEVNHTTHECGFRNLVTCHNCGARGHKQKFCAYFRNEHT